MKEIEILKGRDVVNHLAVALKINELITSYNEMFKLIAKEEKR